MKNVHQAVWIIAILSLLLGLSIGQLHQQHREIEKTEGKTNGVTEIKLKSLNGCWRSSHDGVRTNSSEGLRYHEVKQRMDKIRTQVEREKARLEHEKARLEEEKKIREIKRDKTHVILREEL